MKRGWRPPARMTMFQRAEEIFHNAIDIESEDQRRAFVKQQCGPDETLSELVQRLLAAHVRRDVPDLSQSPELDETVVHEDRFTHIDEDGIRRLLNSSGSDNSLGRVDEFEILSIVGQGGNGVVLRARDTKLNRFVALKMLSPRLAVDTAAKMRFVREAKAAAVICHDNVVSIHSVIEAEDIPLICMELVEGPTLQDLIDKNEGLDIEQVLRIGLQIADGVQAAHRQGIVHRDIKPANILLENGLDRVKITDFGIAQVSGDARITMTGQFTGTPQFMSPEQARGENVDSRSDIFSMGIVLYTMCTGNVPFAGESIIEVMRAVCEEQTIAARKVNPQVPPWLDELIQRMLEKSPRHRIGSADEVSGALRQGIAHWQDPMGTRPPNCRRFRIPRAPSFALPRLMLDPFIALLLILILAVASLPLVAVNNLRLATACLFSVTPLGLLISVLAYRWRCGTAAVLLGGTNFVFSLLAAVGIWLGFVGFNGSMTREIVLAFFALQLIAIPIGLVALFDTLGQRVSRRSALKASLRGLLFVFLLAGLAAGAIRIIHESWAGLSETIAWALLAFISLTAAFLWIAYRKLKYPTPQWESLRRKWIGLSAFACLLAIGVVGAWSRSGTYGEVVIVLEDAPPRCVLTIESTPLREDSFRTISGAESVSRIRLPTGTYKLTVSAPVPAGTDIRDGRIVVQHIEIHGKESQRVEIQGSDLRKPS